MPRILFLVSFLFVSSKCSSYETHPDLDLNPYYLFYSLSHFPQHIHLFLCSFLYRIHPKPFIHFFPLVHLFKHMTAIFGLVQTLKAFSYSSKPTSTFFYQHPSDTTGIHSHLLNSALVPILIFVLTFQTNSFILLFNPSFNFNLIFLSFNVSNSSTELLLINRRRYCNLQTVLLTYLVANFLVVRQFSV